MPCSMAIPSMHIRHLMSLLHAYSKFEANETIGLINQLSSSPSSKVRRSSLMPCNRLRRRAINTLLPLGQIPAALPIAVVTPEHTPTRSHALARRSPVRRSVIWFVDLKNDSKPHSVPPIEVVCQRVSFVPITPVLSQVACLRRIDSRPPCFLSNCHSACQANRQPVKLSLFHCSARRNQHLR